MKSCSLTIDVKILVCTLRCLLNDKKINYYTQTSLRWKTQFITNCSKACPFVSLTLSSRSKSSRQEILSPASTKSFNRSSQCKSIRFIELPLPSTTLLHLTLEVLFSKSLKDNLKKALYKIQCAQLNNLGCTHSLTLPLTSLFTCFSIINLRIAH